MSNQIKAQTESHSPSEEADIPDTEKALPASMPLSHSRPRVSLSSISLLLAIVFYVLTVLYAWHPELASRFELVGGSPARALLLLAVLSGIANPMLAATISHSMQVLQWTLVARPRGHSFINYLLLEPSTGIEGSIHILRQRRLPSIKPRVWSIFRLLSIAMVPILNIVILSNVETRPGFHKATAQPSAHGFGIGTFNASLAPLLQPMADLLIGTRFKDFLSDSSLTILLRGNASREECSCDRQNATPKICSTTYLVPGGIENAAPALLADKSFVKTDTIQPVLAMDQAGYVFDFENGNLSGQYDPETECIIHGFPIGAFQLCLKNRDFNKIEAYIVPCPTDIASNMQCLNKSASWASHEGYGTTLSLFKRHATIAYNGLNGTILSYQSSDTTQMAVNISAPELLKVFDILLGPVDLASPYGQELTALGLGKNKPVAPLTIWLYFQGLRERSRQDCRVNQRALTGLQSLLAIPIYHAQAKDFGELRRLLGGHGDSNATIGQAILNLFPQVSPDTDIYPALLRYHLVVGRGSLIAYIVLTGLTLVLCIAALAYGSCTRAGRRVPGIGPFPSQQLLSTCSIQYEDGKPVPEQNFHLLAEREESEKVQETAKMRVLLSRQKGGRSS